jgi:hypothetical protein
MAVMAAIGLPGAALVDTALADDAADWLHGVTSRRQVEGGINANPARPANGVNFGQFFGDRANRRSSTSFTLTVSRAVDPTVQQMQVGFLVCGLTCRRTLLQHRGVTDRAITSRYQFIIPQAHLDVHLPLMRRAPDMQLLYSPRPPWGWNRSIPAPRPPTAMSIHHDEYSTPFEHVGAMVQWHLTSHLDAVRHRYRQSGLVRQG